MNLAKHVLIFFLDGVGLGGNDPAVNPFVHARMPHLATLFGEAWFLNKASGGAGLTETGGATLVETDPTMGISGRPQSATGQAAILTGRNVPRLVGEHYGPKPNQAVSAVIHDGSLFSEVIASGGTAALLTPYPDRYFQAINSGRRLLSSVPMAASAASIPLFSVEDLRQGRAVSPGFTGHAWHEILGYDDIPILDLEDAGRRIAQLARRYNFSFFEHWPSDRSGHRGSMEEAVQHLETLDTVIGALMAAWDSENGLLIITSDHGNIEEKNHRQHSINPVPTILMGERHRMLAREIHDLTGIARVVRNFLDLPLPVTAGSIAD